jgi:hypothetical protein
MDRSGDVLNSLHENGHHLVGCVAEAPNVS